ncbi:MAG: hypothetical protein HY821_17305 [Acidobacteria bacterium]|nr:hypothetical protein [Acidobacteriota bacterium]
MRRNLIAINLLLAVLIGLAGYQIRNQYLEQLRRQKEFMSAPAPAAPPPVVQIPPPHSQISAANYIAVAAQLVFSKDRNPTVTIEVAPVKPMPPLPRYYGVMNFGTPRVILAAASGQRQKSYSAGETVGEFKLVSIAQSGLVFEWDGKTVNASYADIIDRSAPQQESSAPQSSSAPAPSAAKTVSSVTSVSSADASKPGLETGTGIKACQPGDSSPAGSVVDGYRKLVTETPFGKSCRWEKVN